MNENGTMRSRCVVIFSDGNVPKALNINRLAAGSRKVITNTNPAKVNVFDMGISKNCGINQPKSNTRYVAKSNG